MHKKAQAAMEFLMTYGWAILVVLVAVGALVYFGFFNPEKMMPNTDFCSCHHLNLSYLDSIKIDSIEYYSCHEKIGIIYDNITGDLDFVYEYTLFICHDKTLTRID